MLYNRWVSVECPFTARLCVGNMTLYCELSAELQGFRGSVTEDSVFWDMILFHGVMRSQHLKGTSCLHLQGSVSTGIIDPC
jgi:hypothetical protein